MQGLPIVLLSLTVEFDVAICSEHTEAGQYQKERYRGPAILPHCIGNHLGWLSRHQYVLGREKDQEVLQSVGDHFCPGEGYRQHESLIRARTVEVIERLIS